MITLSDVSRLSVRSFQDKSSHKHLASHLMFWLDGQCDLQSAPLWFPLFNLHIGSMACPICLWEPALVCGQLSSVWCWWLQMPALWFVTSHVSQRKLSPHSSASSSSTRPWRNSSTWGITIPLTRTTTWTNSPCTRMWTIILARYPVQRKCNY